ncbi:hypothetical protein WS71_04240 [Burkholderia mayonis]|uniref:Uncharacterized protein n=1 Tax=Burkholderia mayonis TaxID=1385591 RepID=A0A1B4FSH9_9BURK|nr:hypothetical protein WS71_04240 [Burkholderia mayonis]KVE51161.1 hypothetical protein WS71_12600 [Burkholderia mayonis]
MPHRRPRTGSSVAEVRLRIGDRLTECIVSPVAMEADSREIRPAVPLIGMPSVDAKLWSMAARCERRRCATSHVVEVAFRISHFAFRTTSGA